MEHIFIEPDGFYSLRSFRSLSRRLEKCHHSKHFLDAGIERARNQTNLQPPLAVVVGHHEPTKPVQPSKNIWLRWLKYLSYQGDWLGDLEMRGSLMVMATVITTITFQPILNPPGGVWQTNEPLIIGNEYNITCPAGTSVFACNADQYRYSAFLTCNTFSFTASLCVTVLLTGGFPLRNKLSMGLLTFSMRITLTFVAFAYVCAFILLTPNQLYFFDYYASDPKFILPNYVLLSLIAVVGIVLLIHTVRLLIRIVLKIRKFTLYIRRR